MLRLIFHNIRTGLEVLIQSLVVLMILQDHTGPFFKFWSCLDWVCFCFRAKELHLTEL